MDNSDLTLIIDNDEGMYSQVHEALAGRPTPEGAGSIIHDLVRNEFESRGFNLSDGSFLSQVITSSLGDVAWDDIGAYYLDDVAECEKA